MLRFRASALVCGTLLTGCGVLANAACGGGDTKITPLTPTLPTVVVPGGALVFRASGNARSDLVRVGVDGSNATVLPATTGYDAGLSPDGASVATTREGHIWIADADGSNARDITPDLRGAAFISWSPDASHILFGFFGETFGEWWLMNRNGTGQVKIVPRCQLPRGDCYRPQWSRDASVVLAEIPSNGAENLEGTALVVLGLDGAVQRRLPNAPNGWDEFTWSPDGNTIAYVTGRRIGQGVLAVMGPDGSNVRQIFRGDQPHSLAWSPDSTRIAFSVQSIAQVPGQPSPPPALWELVVAEPASGDTQVLSASASVGQIAWSPDGQRISYTGDAGDPAFQRSQVYVIAASGGQPVNVSNGPWHDVSATWSADGQTLLFHSDRNSRDGIYALDATTRESHLVAALPPYGGQTDQLPFHRTDGGCITVDRTVPGPPLYACKAPDRASLASMEHDRLVVTDLTTSVARAASDARLVAAQSPPAWSADSRRVAFIARDGDNSALYVLDVGSGRTERLVAAEAVGNVTQSVIWAPDGNSIYFTDGAFCIQGCVPGFLYRINADGSGVEKLSELRVLTLYGFEPP